MSNYKSKKFKKLKRKRVWPSVLIFILTLIFMTIMLLAIIGTIISTIISESFSYSYLNSAHVIDAVEAAYAKGEDFNQTLSGIEHDGICILDENDNVVAGVGEFTANLKVPISLDDIHKLYLDKEKTFISEKVKVENVIEMDEDGSTYVDLRQLMGLLLSDNENYEGDMQKSVLAMTCWLITDAEIGSNTLLVKSVVSISEDNIIRIIASCILLAIAMFIPLIVMFCNVISAVVSQGKLRKVIYFDEVTGGNNWSYFKERGKKILCKYVNKKKTYFIADLEFMKYRSFCACCGVEEGERVLENIYRYINNVIGKKGVCARYGRANFAIMCPCDGGENARAILTSIENGMNGIAGNQRVIFHAGYIVLEPWVNRNGGVIKRENMDMALLYNNASAARASITSNEEHAVAEFTSRLLEDQLWEHKVEAEMQAAIDNREFVVFYQPKYNPVTEKLVGAEALIRWIKPDGIIPPGKFIPIFEKNGFITKIDDYMIDNVARQQAQWFKEGKNIVPVSVNISRAHFTKPDLAEHISHIVDRYDIPHKYIEIELTESAFFDDKSSLIKTVRRLKELGFEISMDDFGAGYSSLNSLKDLPLDVLKLDADFFRGEDDDERAEIVVSSAIALAKNLDMRIVAEGIEKKNQVDFLAGVGCDMIQGYYYAKPMPVDDFVVRLQGSSTEDKVEGEPVVS